MEASLLKDVAAFLSALGLGAVVGALLNRWLSRGRPHLSLIRIVTSESASRTGASRVVLLDDDTVRCSQEFEWGDAFSSNRSTYGQASQLAEQAEDFNKDADRIIKKIDALKTQLERPLSREDKLTVVKDIGTDERLHSTLTTALLRREVTINPDLTGARILDYQIAKKSNREDEYWLLDAPKFRVGVPVYEPSLKSDLDLAKPYVEALAFFDAATIKGLLEFAENDFRKKNDVCEKLLQGLRPVVETRTWQVDVFASNAGDRIILLSPYASLAVSDVNARSSVTVPPLPLTAVSLSTSYESERAEGEIAETASERLNTDAYIVVPPQAGLRITFVSDEEVTDASKHAPLLNLYKANIFSCSVVMKREGIDTPFRGDLKVSSPRVRFGSTLADQLRADVAKLAK